MILIFNREHNLFDPKTESESHKYYPRILECLMEKEWGVYELVGTFALLSAIHFNEDKNKLPSEQIEGPIEIFKILEIFSESSLTSLQILRMLHGIINNILLVVASNTEEELKITLGYHGSK